MIVYLDTAALVPLVIDEPASSRCVALWEVANRVMSTRLTYIEASAALAQAMRMGRMSPAELRRSQSLLHSLWLVMETIELGPRLMAESARAAERHGLRGYDATHCAAAVLAADTDTVAATGDKKLLAAWHAEGLAVADINGAARL